MYDALQDIFIAARNAISRTVYQGFLKPVFFLNDPETVHDGLTRFGMAIGGGSLGRGCIRALFGYRNPILHQTVLGIKFENPIGLAAGFDKNAQLTDILPSVGFGHAEIGSVTGAACPGNPKPRLWRLPKSKSLAVYYGLKNDGSEAIAKRLQQRLQRKLDRRQARNPAASLSSIPIGISVAMANSPENAADIARGIEDFAKAFRTMEPLASYVTVNISCPNAAGGQPFIKPENFDALFAVLDAIPTTPLPSGAAKPVFIKLSPDLSDEQLDALLDIAHRHRIHGVICTNLTKQRQNEKIMDDKIPEVGGLSGKVVDHLSDAMIERVYRRERARSQQHPESQQLVIIGCGGVFTAEDAYRKIRNGAALIQLITGMIFEGPQAISEINRGLAKLLARDGYANIAEAVGTAVLY